jgi:L-lactate dehydrogenase (cytochrome)
VIISSGADYAKAARAKLPRFLFDYLDGGSYAEATLRDNVSDLSSLHLRQRVLRNVADISLSATLFGEEFAMPGGLAPVGLGGMYARRGEVQVGRAAKRARIPYIISTVSLCPLEEIIRESGCDVWFQLYVLKDRGFMRHALEHARALGVTKLVFTVDMPVPGARYRDRHSGLSGAWGPLRRMLQACGKPAGPGTSGCAAGRTTSATSRTTSASRRTRRLHRLARRQFRSQHRMERPGMDPRVLARTHHHQGHPRSRRCRDALRFGAQGIVVSNHGGRQLDGALSTTRALPAIVDAVGDRTHDPRRFGGAFRTRCGPDAGAGSQGSAAGSRLHVCAGDRRRSRGHDHLLGLIEKEMRVAMALTGVKSIARSIDFGE